MMSSADVAPQSCDPRVGLAYVSEFVEYAKASGLVQQAIERAGRIGITLPA